MSSVLVVERPCPACHARSFGLTELDVRTLQLLAEGMKEREIAVHEFITLNSVKYRTKVIRRKLSVGSNAAAVGVALQEGFITA